MKKEDKAEPVLPASVEKRELQGGYPADALELDAVLEKNHVYEVKTEVGDLDEYGFLKPHAYQGLFAQIAERHLTLFHLDVDMTLKHNLAWALVSLSLEFPKPVEGCMRLYATTWHSGHKGPYFRRELVFKNEEGAVMFHGATFSVLLDMEKRSVFRKRELPFPVHEPIEEYVIEASPSAWGTPPLSPFGSRTVRNSHLDCLGHVNNCRYGEYAHDALTEEECENLRNLRRMDIRFISELRRGDTFSILKAEEVTASGKRITIRGCNNATDTVSFDVAFTFPE